MTIFESLYDLFVVAVFTSCSFPYCRDRTSSLSPPITIGGTVPKKSEDLVILGVTFESEMTFKKKERQKIKNIYSN